MPKMKIIKLIPVFALGLTLLFLSVKGESEQASEQDNKNLTLLEKWQNLEKTAKGFVKDGIKMILPSLTENSGKVKVSNKCTKDILHLISGLKSLKSWAVQFLDSSAKTWDGLLVGTVSAFGAYDECLDIMVNSTKIADNGKRLFVGQYCLIDVHLPIPDTKVRSANIEDLPDELKEFAQKDNVIAEAARSTYFYSAYSPRLGICTPSGCSANDINGIISSLGSKIGIDLSVFRCEVKEENKYTPLVIGVITYCSIFTLLLIIGTLIGAYVFYSKAVIKNLAIRMLLAFSCITNFKKFTSTHTESKTLNCLYGLRFLTMTWVILCHTYLNVVNRAMHGGKKFLTQVGEFSFQVIVNGSLQVDIYFFLSGLLLCYIILTKVKTQNYKFNGVMYVVHRLWRIFPCYSFVLIFSFLVHLFGSGPGYPESLDRYFTPCYDNWWSNLLFINNFYRPKQMCWYHTWYVAAEFQLYLFALVILLPMIKSPKVGVILAFLTIITSILYSAINTYVMNHPPIMLALNLDPGDALEFGSQAYVKPMTHAGPYAVGILTGYLLYTKPNLKLSPMMQVFGWCAAITFSVSTLYGAKNWNGGVEPELAETIFYSGLARTVFVLGISWMIICCATGHAGFINYMLSWDIYIPLGRITFLAYLIHPIVMIVFIGNVKTEIQADHFIFIWFYLGYLCVSYGLAFIAYMLVELPLNNLEIILLFEPRMKGKNLKNANENNATKEINSEKNGNVTTIVQLSISENKSADCYT